MLRANAVCAAQQANKNDTASKARARDERISGTKRNAPTDVDSAACQRSLRRAASKQKLATREGFDDGSEGFGVADDEVTDQQVFA